MSKKILPKVKSLGELRRLASAEDELGERYKTLAMIAAENLGGTCTDLKSAMRHLNMNADETDEHGVLGEVNFVRDIEVTRG